MSSHLRLAPSPVDVVDDVAEAAPIRVVLADDHTVIRQRVRVLLEGEADMELIAEAKDVESASNHVDGKRPNVLVLDLSMPGGSSIEAIGLLRERVPTTQIVLMTMDESPIFAQRALAAGALGYVSKELADQELASAVRAAARGQQYVSPSIAAPLAALNRSLTEHKLTPREVEVLRLLALGHTSVEIACKLHLSPRTVETHRAHIHSKLGMATRADLVGYALRRGLLGV
jgi:two-component system, NarL family, response regulator NreC